jgi:NADH-quinone oxidoreductase subunit N
MAGAVKAAAFAALIRVFVTTFDQWAVDWKPVVYALAVLSLVVGALLAAVQTDVKRMMAYSSINHAGFILLGVEAASAEGTLAVLFYVASYAVIVAGTFGVIAIVAGDHDARTSLDDYNGLSRRRPVLALAFTVLLLAQAGVPFTSGFFAKFESIVAAVEANSYWLAVIAMVTAVVTAFVYLRVIVAMYLVDRPEDADEGEGRLADQPLPIPWTAALGVALAVFITLDLGILPWQLTDLAQDAIPVLVATN